MKIQVVRCDGDFETLTLFGPISVTEPATEDGRVVGQGAIHETDSGMDHYFREDGRYDGWGLSMSDLHLTESQATAFIQTVQNNRQIHKPGEVDQKWKKNM